MIIEYKEMEQQRIRLQEGWKQRCAHTEFRGREQQDHDESPATGSQQRLP